MAIKVQGVTVVDNARNANVDSVSIGGTSVIDNSRNITNVGSVSATCFIGDGSLLTGVAAGFSTNCREIAPGSSAILIGDPVSGFDTNGNTSITKTLGDPTTVSFAQISQGGEGPISCRPQNQNGICCCVLCYEYPKGPGFEFFVPTSNTDFFRIYKKGVTTYASLAAAGDGTASYDPNCYIIETYKYCADELCLAKANTNYVVECHCSGDYKTFNCSVFSTRCAASIPFNSVTAFSFKRCCCSSYCNHRLFSRCEVSKIGGAFGGTTYNFDHNRFAGSCCICTCYNMGSSRFGPVTSQGAMLLHSCTDNYLYVAFPTQVASCHCCACRHVHAENGYVKTATYEAPGAYGMQVWKFAKCSGKPNEVCTTPESIVENQCHCFRMGAVTKEQRFMIGDCSFGGYCKCCNASDQFSDQVASTFTFVHEINDSLCFNPVCGCVPGSERISRFGRVATGTTCANSVFDGATRKYWPMSEDENGWIIYTIPCWCQSFKGPGSNQCQMQSTKYWTLNVGAVKPISTGCAIFSDNEIQICHSAANEGAWCMGDYNGQENCCYGSGRCIGCLSSIAGCCCAGGNFGLFAVIHDAHMITSGAASCIVDGCQTWDNDAQRKFISGVAEYVCHTKQLPEAVMTGARHSAANNEVHLCFVPFFSGYMNPGAYGTPLCGQTGHKCNFSMTGPPVDVRVKIDNSSNTVSLLACSGSFANLCCMGSGCFNNPSQCVSLCCVYNAAHFAPVVPEGTDINDQPEYALLHKMRPQRRINSKVCRCSGFDSNGIGVHDGRTCMSLYGCTFDINHACHMQCGTYCRSSAGLYSAFDVTPEAYYYVLNPPERITPSTTRLSGWQVTSDPIHPLLLPNSCCVSIVGTSVYPGSPFRCCSSDCFKAQRYSGGLSLCYGICTVVCCANCFCCFSCVDVVTASGTANYTDYFSTVSFWPKCAYNVGSSGATVFVSQSGDTAAAASAGQNNTCKFLGYASEAGTAGDNITFMTNGAGTVPAECFDSSISSNFNHHSPMRCFICNNRQVNCYIDAAPELGVGVVCMAGTGPFGATCCLNICAAYDPTTNCYSAFFATGRVCQCDRC